MLKKRTGTQSCDPSADPSDSAPTRLEENLADDDENGDILYMSASRLLANPPRLCAPDC